MKQMKKKVKTILFYSVLLLLFLFTSFNIAATFITSPALLKIVTTNDPIIAKEFLSSVYGTDYYAEQKEYFNDKYGKKAMMVSSTNRNNDQRIAELNQLLDRNSSSRDTLVSLAILYYEKGHVNEAKRYYILAKQTDPKVSISQLDEL